MRVTARALVIAATLVCQTLLPRAAGAQDLFRNVFPVPPLVTADPPPDPPIGLDTSSISFDAFESPAGLEQQEPNPKPAHTGLAALVHSTASDFAAFPRRPSTWVILAAGLGAVAITHPADDYVEQHVVGSKTADHIFITGKYLGSTYVETGVAIGLYTIGRVRQKKTHEGTNKLSHLGFDLVRAQILAQAFVQGLKYTVRRDRPTGECCAFPSGHATAAFATASVLERHLGYRGAWPTIVIASYVGASRLIDNRHFLSDVVFGSALGIATGWTVVGRHGRGSYALLPTPVRGGIALTFTRVGRSAADKRTN